MKPLQYAVGVVEPELGAAAGLGRWFVGVAVLLIFLSFFFFYVLLTRQMLRFDGCTSVGLFKSVRL